MAADLVPRADGSRSTGACCSSRWPSPIAASALSSLAPLWQAMRTQPPTRSSDGVRTTAGARSRRLSGSLVVGRGRAGLHAARRQRRADLRGAGARAHLGRLRHARCVTFQLTLPDALAQRRRRTQSRHSRLRRALSAIPGVQAVGFANQTPLDGCCLSTAIYPDGTALDLRAPQKVAFLPVNPDYFRALGLSCAAAACSPTAMPPTS